MIVPLTAKMFTFRSPFIHITFHEYDNGDDFECTATYDAISRYLDAKQAAADIVGGSDAIDLSMSEDEEFVDEFEGIKLWWAFGDSMPRFFELRFHRKLRNLVTGKYLEHVLTGGKEILKGERRERKYSKHVSAKGKAISIREGCRRKLCTINGSSNDYEFGSINSRTEPGFGSSSITSNSSPNLC